MPQDSYQITRRDAIDLFWCFKIDAEQWGPKKLTKRLEQLPERIPEDTTLEEEWYDNLLTELRSAVEMKRPVEVVLQKDFLSLEDDEVEKQVEIEDEFLNTEIQDFDPLIKEATPEEVAPVRLKQYDISYKGPVSVMSEFGIARFDPNEGCSAADVLVDVYERCGIFINTAAKRKSSKMTDKRKLFYLWRSKYMEWTGTYGELASIMQEEAGVNVSTASIRTWLSEWRAGRSFPVM